MSFLILPRNVNSLWWNRRWIGSRDMYWSVSCIHPMSHLRPKPKPPAEVGLLTLRRGRAEYVGTTQRAAECEHAAFRRAGVIRASTCFCRS